MSVESDYEQQLAEKQLKINALEQKINGWQLEINNVLTCLSNADETHRTVR